MKKILLLTIAMFGYAASASMLLWMVDSPVTVNGTEYQAGDFKAGIAYGSSASHENTTALNVGSQAANASNWGTSLSGTALGNIAEAEGFALADLSLLANSAATYFFIEIYDSSGSLIGWSETGTLGSNLASQIKEWEDLSSTAIQSLSGWSGSGVQFVPEPTSGIMLLLGMAVLGLRRRRTA